MSCEWVSFILKKYQYQTRKGGLTTEVWVLGEKGQENKKAKATRSVRVIVDFIQRKNTELSASRHRKLCTSFGLVFILLGERFRFKLRNSFRG